MQSLELLQDRPASSPQRLLRCPRLFHFLPPAWPVQRRPGRPARTPPALTSPIILSWRQQLLTFVSVPLSPLSLQVEQLLRRLARAGHALPDNPTMAEMTGGHGRNTMLRILARLERAGHIKIDKEPNRRRVLVLDMMRWTDWGPSRPGHAPYSSCSREEYRAMAARDIPTRPAVIRLGRPERIAYDDDFGLVETCQHIIADAPYRGALPVFCNAPVQRGKSWCAGHHAHLTRGGARAFRPMQFEGEHYGSG